MAHWLQLGSMSNVSLPNVPMMYHNSTRKQKTIILIIKSQSLRKRMEPFAQDTCKFLNLILKPVASTLLPHPPTPKKPAIFTIHSNYQGTFRMYA